MTLLERLRRQAKLSRCPAIVSNNGEISYADLLERVLRAASALQVAGVSPGLRVGLTIADEPEHLIVSLALIVVGAEHITLATHDSPTLRATIAQRAGVSLVLDDGSNETEGVNRLAWPASSSGPQFRAVPEGMALLRTSGTTGDMNIVAFSIDMLVSQAQRHAEYSEERLLRLAPVEHNNSKRHRLYALLMGGTNVFRPPGAFDIAEFCRRHRVSCLDISRMHAADLAAHSDSNSLIGVKIRTGGSAVPIDVRRAIETRVTKQLYVRYAATEFGAISMAGPGDHDDDESVGRPLRGVELQIVDDQDIPVPVGTTGHIVLRGAGMATGYLQDQEQSAERFRNGWFRPGDMGTLRADGQLLVRGRRDDMMILNGLNIFPAEIERVLERHPEVATAAALPLPSRVHGQIPVAAVELRAGAAVVPAQLLAYARELLALRAPRRIIVVDTMPRNSQGKVVRRQLLTLFEHPEKPRD